MAKLELDIVIGNLNKIKTSFEKSLQSVKLKGEKGGGGGGGFAIGGWVAVLGKLLESTKSAVALLQIIGALINQLVAPFVPILVMLIKPVMVLLRKFIFSMMNFFGIINVGDETKTESLKSMGSSLAQLNPWVIIYDRIKEQMPMLTEIFLKNWETLKTIFTNAWETLKTSLSGIWDNLKTIFTGSWETLSILLSEIWDNFETIFTDSFDSLKDVLSSLWDTGKEILKPIWDVLADIFTSAWQYIKDILKGAWEGLKGIWEWLLNTLKSGIISFANLFIDGFNAIIKIINKALPKSKEIGTVSKAGNPNMNTTINVNIDGGANEETVDKMIKTLRKEQMKRGVGSF